MKQGEFARYPPILAGDYLKMRLDASKPKEAALPGVLAPAGPEPASQVEQPCAVGTVPPVP